jgi:hypothetical protein
MVHQQKCVGVTVQAHIGLQVCAGPYYSTNIWINSSWLLDWPHGFVELATIITRPQAPWLQYVGLHEISCLWMHGEHNLCQWPRCSSLCYTFHCETSKNMHWSWMLTFWIFVSSVKGACGCLVGWSTMLQAGRSRVQVPMRWIIFNLPNPSSSTMALGSIQPLT